MDRDQIFRLLQARIVGWATSKVGGDLAEDLAQEVLVVLNEKYGHIENLQDLLPLSFRILEHKIRNLQRRSARRREDEKVPVEDVLLTTEALGESGQIEGIIDRERSILLREAVSRLEPDCRELFRLLLQGHSQAQISKKLDLPVGTVYARRSRCLAELREGINRILDERKAN